ncbi:MAG: CBS domain-containing protein [Acidimicrobiales bacterium]|nr:CBS domain-containing protein [Acidimicrobiales bacterium]MBO0887387.1 CBS domain-containing protein [Acidimicrobiales bacterium]
MSINDESSVPVAMIMHTSVQAIDRQSTLRTAAGRLRDAEVGTLAIMEGSAIAGIVSERDVVRALADGADPDEVWVGDVMSELPRYLTPGDSVHGALEVMLAAGIRHLPVVDEGELVGIVSIRDVARHLRHWTHTPV